MPRYIFQEFWKIKALRMLDGKNSWNVAVFPRMGTSGAPDSDVAERLSLLQAALGFHGHGAVSAFARSVQVDPKRYHNFVNGLPLSREVAIILVQRIPGLTLDWLYLGKEEGLSFKLASDLRTAGELKAKTGAE